MIRLVIFDIDHTTIETRSKTIELLIEAMFRFHFPVDHKDLEHAGNYRKSVAIEMLLRDKFNIDNETDLRPLRHSIQHHFEKSLTDHFSATDFISVPPFVEKTLAELRESGVQLAINTSFTQDIADLIVKRLGWKRNGWIQEVVSIDDVQRYRPFPDMIFETMRRFNINDPAQVAKIGDTPEDMLEGSLAGAGMVIGIAETVSRYALLMKEKPTHIVSNIAEIPSLIYQKSLASLAS